ncbi:MAG: hypothetical protein R3266_01815 [Gemmatimonadota bacterium]|nr:hypothetical protein [Gemmatimonadota bacterium]
MPGPRFEASLRRVADTLDVPVGAKVAILAELRADLEDLYAHYRLRGLSREVAIRRAEALLAPEPGAVRRLVRLHAGGWRRLAVRLSDRTRRGFEHAALAAGAIVALGSAGLLASRANPLPSSDPLLWIVAAVGALVLAVGSAAAARLFVLGRWSRRLASYALPGFSVAGGSVLAIGAFGALFRLQRAATARGAGRLDELELVARLGREATLAGTSLCVAFAAGALGFLVVNRIRALQEMEVAHLL